MAACVWMPLIDSTISPRAGIDIDVANRPGAQDIHPIHEAVPVLDGKNAERRLAADAGAGAGRRSCNLVRALQPKSTE